MDKTFWQASTRFLLVVLAGIFIITSIYIVLPLIYPFLIGLVFALFFNPLVSWLEKRARFPRWLSVTLSILILISLIVSLVILIILEIASEINNIKERFPEFIEDYTEQMELFIMSNLLPFYDQFFDYYMSLDEEIRKNIEQQLQNVSTSFANLANSIITGLIDVTLTIISKIPTIATAFIISLLAAFFISKDWPKLSRRFAHIVPQSLHKTGKNIVHDLQKALFGFIKAQFTLISITFIIVLCGLLILRVEYALTLSIIIGVIDLLPYLGTGLIFIPWIIYLFITSNYYLAIGLTVLYGIVLIQRQMMEPKILGTNVGLDPLLTLVALFVGFKIFGLSGLIIGPVLMVIIAAFHRAGIFRDLWSFIRGAA